MARRWFLRSVLTAAALATSIVLLPGCGYSLAGRGSFLPDYIKVIGVPTFANRPRCST
jgi:hypothetical protein